MAAENRQLTGLRGVLALGVVVGHYSAPLPWLTPFLFHNVAVDYFFCLSGVVLGIAYSSGSARHLDVARYVVSRFARIYPTYLLSLLVTLGLCVLWRANNFAVESPARLAGEFVSQLLLVGALPIPAVAGFWNVPSWSVSVELFCYIAVFPLLFRASAAALRWPAGLRIGLVMAACACDFLFFRACFDPAVLGVAPPAPVQTAAWWVASVRGATMFAAGWLTHLACLRSARLGALLGRSTDLAAMLFMAWIAFGPDSLGARQALVFLAPPLIAGLLTGESWTAQLLAWQPVWLLGRISYPLYLLHVPILLAAYHAPFVSGGPVRLFVLPLAASIALASLTALLVEQPARRALKSWLLSRFDRQPAPEALSLQMEADRASYVGSDRPA